MKAKGFTLLELLIVVAVLSVITVIIFPFISHYLPSRYGTSQCVNGYMHVVGMNGHITQTFDNHGNGIPCDPKFNE